MVTIYYMCGIGAIIHNDTSYNIINDLYDILLNLQHRGQESSGFITYSFINKLNYKSKEFGLVNKHIPYVNEFKGNMGIAHVRYPTNGNVTKLEIQPFHISKPYGISLVHNGNIINKDSLIRFLIDKNIYIQSTSDSDVILNIFYYYIEKNLDVLTNANIINAIEKIYDMCIGSFSIIIMINNFGLIAFRDKHGIRPLAYSSNQYNITIASETVALNDSSYNNINNGEIMIINKNMNIFKHSIHDLPMKLIPCLFEYIYFARLESYINDILVYKFREKMGEKMLELIDKNILDKVDAIIPVPLTSIVSATAISNITRIPLVHAIVKNRYLYRSFINKNAEIMKTVQKIYVIGDLIKNKNILIVDDSIVRGNTSKHIVKELRKYNVKNIYFACCSPPIKHPNIYGISIPTYQELITHNRSIDDIQKYLEVDKLYYLTIEKMYEALKELNPNIIKYEDSVFTGNYFLL